MILSKPDILRYIEGGTLEFSPSISPDQVGQVSIDLRLGHKFTTFKEAPHISAIRVTESLWSATDLWRSVEQDNFILRPNEFVLAQTFESVTIPHDLVGLIEGRSSFARAGITVHVTAPKIDPGFSGTITLEMTNLSPVAVDLRAEEDHPAQLIFAQLSTPLSERELYGSRTSDIFQHQTDPLPQKKT